MTSSYRFLYGFGFELVRSSPGLSSEVVKRGGSSDETVNRGPVLQQLDVQGTSAARKA